METSEKTAEKKATLRSHNPIAIKANGTSVEETLALIMCSNQASCRNNIKLKNKLKSRDQENFALKDTNENLIKRIKMLESVVEKRGGIVAEKDHAWDANRFVNSKLQNRIVKDRSERVDNKNIINETKKLKESMKNMVTHSKEIQS